MENDFSKLLYNPFTVPQGTMIWDHYKALGRRAHLSVVPRAQFQKEEDIEIPGAKDLSLLITFVILFVDPKSPFADESNFEDRTKACLEAARVPNNSVVHRVVAGNHWWFGLVMTTYFQIIHARDYEQWFALKVQMHQQNAFLRESIGDGQKIVVKNQIIAGMEKNSEVLERLENKLFRSDNMRDKVVEAATSDMIVGYAEKHAKIYNA